MVDRPPKQMPAGVNAAPETPPPTEQLTYWVESEVRGRRRFGGRFQLFQAIPVDPDNPVFGPFKAELEPIGAYFEHRIRIKNTGTSRVASPITIELQGPDGYRSARDDEEALFAEQESVKAGGPMIRLKPEPDPTYPTLPPRAFQGPLELHRDEELTITLTTVIRDVLSLQAFHGLPDSPVLRCRGVEVLKGLLEPRKNLLADTYAGIINALRLDVSKLGRRLRWAILGSLVVGVAIGETQVVSRAIRTLAAAPASGHTVKFAFKVLGAVGLTVGGSILAGFLLAASIATLRRRKSFLAWVVITIVSAVLTIVL
jgi:hypothetical protein